MRCCSTSTATCGRAPTCQACSPLTARRVCWAATCSATCGPNRSSRWLPTLAAEGRLCPSGQAGCRRVRPSGYARPAGGAAGGGQGRRRDGQTGGAGLADRRGGPDDPAGRCLLGSATGREPDRSGPGADRGAAHQAGRGPVTGAPGARTSRACQSRYVETATQILHRLTSYEPGRAWDAPVDDPRVVQDLQANDPARRPWFFKRYAQQLPRMSLPRDLPATTAPAIAVLAGAADLPRTELDLAQLSRLLHLSAGVVRTMEQPYGTHLFRAAGSAGGRFPLELYVAVPEG